MLEKTAAFCAKKTSKWKWFEEHKAKNKIVRKKATTSQWIAMSLAWWWNKRKKSKTQKKCFKNRALKTNKKESGSGRKAKEVHSENQRSIKWLREREWVPSQCYSWAFICVKRSSKKKNRRTNNKRKKNSSSSSFQKALCEVNSVSFVSRLKKYRYAQFTHTDCGIGYNTLCHICIQNRWFFLFWTFFFVVRSLCLLTANRYVGLSACCCYDSFLVLNFFLRI